MKNKVGFLLAGLMMLALAACGSAPSAPTYSSSLPANSTKPAFATIVNALWDQEYRSEPNVNAAVSPAVYSVLAATVPVANELPVAVSCTNLSNIGGTPFTVVSPNHTSGLSPCHEVVFDFGSLAVRKIVINSPASDAIGWGLQCNTDTNCITGPITYGVVPAGMDVTELKNGGSAGLNLSQGAIKVVFIMTTVGTGVVDKVGWTAFQAGY